jgi:Ca2+-binding RTX toxin-like protein
MDRLAGGEGIDTVSFEQALEGVTVNLGSGAVGGSGTGITISGFENIIGTMHVDTINGDTNNNIIMPLHGGPVEGRPDTIHGGGGMDTLRVDYSNDARVNAQGISMTPNAVTGYEPIALGPNWSVGGDQMVLIYTGIERFEITGGDASDRLYGEGVTWGGWGPDWYNDRLIGRGGNDYIEGRYGDDYLDGGEGNDTLDAGSGSDVVMGGPGDDTIRFDWGGAFGSDLVDAGEGDDNITNLRFSIGDGTSAAASTRSRYDGGPGIDSIRIDLGYITTPFIFDEGAPGEVILPNDGYVRNIERLSGLITGSGNDEIRSVGRYNNQISLRDGNDTIRPGLGIDQLFGGNGFDTVIVDYSEGDDTDTGPVIFNPSGSRLERRQISTGDLLDQLSLASFERMIMTGSSKNDNVRGTGGDDELFGMLGNDVILGDSGHDLIDGGPGADEMRGNHGNDTYIVDDPLDIVIDTEAQGTDTVRASIDYVLPNYVEHLVLTGSALYATGNFSGNSITGNAQNNILNGMGGNDTLHGNGGPSEIDRLIGGTGADTFVLMSGRDRSYDDGSTASAGIEGYAIIEDFTPSQNDRLRLAGAASEYHLAPTPAALGAKTGLYHDSNSNGAYDDADELIAIVESAESLTRANTLDNANYVGPLTPATIGLSELGAAFSVGTQEATVTFELNDPMAADVLLEVQSSSDLTEWTTIASKAGTSGWTGTGNVEVVAAGAGRVRVNVTLPAAPGANQYFRARLLNR